MMREQSPVRRAGHLLLPLAVVLSLTSVDAPLQAQDVAAEPCGPQVDLRGVSLQDWRALAVQATDRLTDSARRNQARELLGKAMQFMDQGCAQPAENSLSALRALDLGAEASRPLLMLAATTLQAEIMSWRGDRDGAEAVFFASADKAKAQRPNADEERRPFLIEAANLRIREGIQRRLVSSLERSVTLYRDILLPDLSKTENPTLWWLAKTQLSVAFYSLGERQGLQGAAQFRAALAAAEESLTSSVAQPNSSQWLRSQLLLGAAVTALVPIPSSDQQALLQRAIAIHRSTLATITAAGQPNEWASTKGHLATALMTQAIEVRGPRSPALLKEALQSQTEALTVYTRASEPLRWAEGTANNATIAANMATFERTKAPATAHMTRAVALMSSAVAVFEEQQSNEQAQQAKAMLGRFRADLARFK